MGSSQISLQLSCRNQTQKTAAGVGTSQGSPSPAGFPILGKSWRAFSCPHPHCCGVPSLYAVITQLPQRAMSSSKEGQGLFICWFSVPTQDATTGHLISIHWIKKKKVSILFFLPIPFHKEKQLLLVTYIQYRWTDQSPEKRGCRWNTITVNEEAMTGFGARRAPWDEVIGWWLGLKQEGLVLGTTLQTVPYMVISIYSMLMSHFKSQNSCETKHHFSW